MKKIFLVIVLTVAMTLPICGCSNKSGNTTADEINISETNKSKIEQKLQGLWGYIGDDDLAIIFYFSDGKFYSEFANKAGKLLDATKGTYTINNEMIILSTSNDNSGFRYEYDNNSLELYLDNNKFTKVYNPELENSYESKLF